MLVLCGMLAGSALPAWAQKASKSKNENWITVFKHTGNNSGNKFAYEHKTFVLNEKFEKVRFRWRVKRNEPAFHFHATLYKWVDPPAKFQTVNAIVHTREAGEGSTITKSLSAGKYQIEFRYQRIGLEFWVEGLRGKDGPKGVVVKQAVPRNISTVGWTSIMHHTGNNVGNKFAYQHKTFELRERFEQIRFRWRIKRNEPAFHFHATLYKWVDPPAKFQTVNSIVHTREAGEGSILTRALSAGKYQIEFRYQRIGLEFWVEGKRGKDGPKGVVVKQAVPRNISTAGWTSIMHHTGNNVGNKFAYQHKTFELRERFERVRFRWRIKRNEPAFHFHATLYKWVDPPAKFQTVNSIVHTREAGEGSIITKALSAGKYQIEFRYQRLGLEFWVEGYRGKDGPKGVVVAQAVPRNISTAGWTMISKHTGNNKGNKFAYEYRTFELKEKFDQVRFRWRIKRNEPAFHFHATLYKWVDPPAKFQTVNAIVHTREAGEGFVLTRALGPGKYQIEFRYQRLGLEFWVEGKRGKDGPKQVVTTTSILDQQKVSTADWTKVFHHTGNNKGNKFAYEHKTFELREKFEKIRFRWLIKRNEPAFHFHATLYKWVDPPAEFQTVNSIVHTRQSGEGYIVTKALGPGKYQIEFRYQRIGLNFWVEGMRKKVQLKSKLSN